MTKADQVKLDQDERDNRRRLAQAKRDDVDAALLGVGLDRTRLASVRPFFGRNARLTQIPAGRAKRLIVLDLLAHQFTPGQLYSESRVNLILGRFNPDWAALRRYLVDEAFLDRRDGMYWRIGGTFDTAVGDDPQ